MIANMKVFDCTLREVGYQTGWYFDKKVVQDIYRFAESRHIDYIELGFFHNEEADPNRGDFRYCSMRGTEIMNTFAYVKNRTKLSAMRDIQRPISELKPKKDSPIDAIRILTRSHETDIDRLKFYVNEAQELGYEVYINFTSAGNNTPEITECFAECAKNMGVPIIYFADTESIMTNEFVDTTINICKEFGVGVGMHFHDKNGTAEELADTAIKNGVNGIDVTHIGLGGKWRDGNLTMEYLMKKFGINLGFENTVVRNEIIEQIIKFNKYTAAE